MDAAARYGFVLAGGYAVQAYGFLSRRAEDVDLFTSADAQASRSKAAADVSVVGHVYQPSASRTVLGADS